MWEPCYALYVIKIAEFFLIKYNSMINLSGLLTKDHVLHVTCIHYLDETHRIHLSFA